MTDPVRSGSWAPNASSRPSSAPGDDLRVPKNGGGEGPVKKGGLLSSVWIPAAVLAVAVLGSLPVESGPGSWYDTMAKPAWNPPSWLFGPVWTLIYVMIAWSGWLVLGGKGRRPRPALDLFVAQLILNLLWPLLFFGLRLPGWALVEILALLAVIAAMIGGFKSLSRPAAFLLVPYLLWVGFAALLNGSIWWLNR